MPRPILDITNVDPSVRGWDAIIAQDFANVKAAYESVPLPHCLVYKTTPLAGAVDIATLAAADYYGCTVYVTDAATVATNGHLAYSDGSTWKYVKSEAAV